MEMMFWRTIQHLIYPSLNLLYCPIPKVACSSLKVWLLDILGIDLRSSGMCHHQYSLKHFERASLDDVPPYSQLYKIIFVRNPWDRLVSAYLDKFVLRKGQGVMKIVEKITYTVQDAAGQSRDIEAGITFRQFVEYLWQYDAVGNEHWMPQACYLTTAKFDRIARFEHLDDEVYALQQYCKTSEVFPYLNAIPRQPTEEAFADKSPPELRLTENCPPYKAFYDDILMERVAWMYADDIRMLEYEF